jgi:hypothetical protein
MLTRASLFTPLLLLGLAARGSAQAPAWEYAQFTTVGQIAFVWEAGDSTVLSEPGRVRDVGLPDKTPRVIRQIDPTVVELNRIGAAGWELVAIQSQGGTSVYTFKRRKA